MLGRGIENDGALLGLGSPYLSHDAQPVGHARTIRKFSILLARIAHKREAWNRLVLAARVRDGPLHQKKTVLRSSGVARILAYLRKNARVDHTVYQRSGSRFFAGGHDNQLFFGAT